MGSIQGAGPETSYLQHGTRAHPEDVAGDKLLTIQIQGPPRREDQTEVYLQSKLKQRLKTQG